MRKTQKVKSLYGSYAYRDEGDKPTPSPDER